MRRITMAARFMLAISFVIYGLSAQARGGEEGNTLRVGGSTTLLPIIADAASRFMEKYETWNKVDPNLPAETILIYVTGGGSGFGVKSAMNGAFDIGCSSRPLKAEEEAKLGAHHQYLLSKDCLAFAANASSALAKATDNLTRDEAARIVSGEAKTWKDVRSDLPATPIVNVIRDAASGSSEMVKQIVLDGRGFSSEAIQVASQGANIKKLEGNDNAFGYLSSVLAQASNRLKVFTYEGVEPSNENVLSGKYAITRPLLLIVKGEPGPMARAFVDYLLNDGQEIVEAYGYVPVKQLSEESK
ncbi:MAG: phosphate ABC transporter substrate-binding protein [Planctomycetota bacterium]|nr:phosphate ABC transporter substrate-binding protein [Planctomycetota bacterium]